MFWEERAGPPYVRLREITERGGMKLLLADVRLHRARLLRDKAELKKARSLIESCSY